MRPLPLKWRLSLLVTGAMVAVIVVALSVSYHEARELMFHQLDRTLLAMSRGIAAVLDEPETPEVQKKEVEAIVGASRQKQLSFYTIWLDQKGEVSSGGLARKDPPISADTLKAPVPSPGRSVFRDVTLRASQFRVVWHRIPVGQDMANIVVGLSTDDIRKELRELLRTTMIVGGSVIGGMVFLVVFLVAWGLHPIKSVAQRLHFVTANNVDDVNLDVRSAPSEIRPFVESVSGMLSRLGQAIQQQKTFISDASHELRTPIALAKSTVQLSLSRQRGIEEYRQALANALDDLRRMEHLTHELLLLARMDETENPPHPVEVDLAAILQGLGESFAAHPSGNDGRLSLDLQPVKVLGDESQLLQLFSNLIDNALRHGPKDGAVRLVAAREADWAVVTVHDDGGNIPPDALPHLFDRFYRVDPSRSHGTGGAGLGLAIAREIVTRHRGQITISSDPQSGTSVHVRLPISM
ncbi:MAG: ATP-binding protein [Phycisphaerae bacterium]